MGLATSPSQAHTNPSSPVGRQSQDLGIRSIRFQQNTPGASWLLHSYPHAKPATRRSWDYRAKEGFYIGPALDSFRCFKVVKMDTKSQVISDTVEFRHAYRTIPAPTAEDRITQGLRGVMDALTDTPPPTTISQLKALSNLRDVFES